MKNSNYLIRLFGLFIVIISLISCSKDEDDKPKELEKSPYISKVYEYAPAPGQAVNALIEYKEGDTKESVLERVSKMLSGNKLQNEDDMTMVSLGGFGGYIVFGFDHMVSNIKDKKDFKVFGNSFYADKATRRGSCEPGIILVSFDKNKNGLPDDDWYEIAGSEYNNVNVVKDYEITYNKPVAGSFDIEWVDNKGGSGVIKSGKTIFPSWFGTEAITYKGTRLPDNARKTDGVWSTDGYPWGYADNAPDNDEMSSIDIDWAVDKDGKPANLEGINFVKVYSAINQSVDIIGEVSTEISGAFDLNFR